jgi:hypothetical protein
MSQRKLQNASPNEERVSLEDLLDDVLPGLNDSELQLDEQAPGQWRVWGHTSTAYDKPSDAVRAYLEMRQRQQRRGP